MQEQELFEGYEIKNWNFNSRIYKILAISAIFNILALLFVAQTNLLTTKGCDSPLVGGVCQVLDALYVGGTVLATDRGYVDGDYEKTELQNAEIIWVDRTGDEDFKYPEGYFALSNPELMIPTEIPTDAPFPDSLNPPTGGTTNLMNEPQVLPTPNDNAVVGKLPDSPLGFDNPTRPNQNNRFPTRRGQRFPKINDKSPDKLPDLTETAEKDPNKEIKNPPDNKVEEIVINKKPMKDFASVVKTKYDNKQIDLSQNFKVVAEGVLTKDGKLDTTEDKKTKLKKSRVTETEGNKEMTDIVTQAIAAIGDSGWLGYLRTQGIEKINFTVVQDDDNLQVIITSDLPTPERANTVTKGVGTAISLALSLDNSNMKKLGEDEKVLLSSAKATQNPTNAKQFVLNFLIPKTTALEMIKRKLNEPQDPAEPKENGNTGQIKETRQNAAK